MSELTKLIAKPLKFFLKRINYSQAVILFTLSLLLTIIAPAAIAGYTPPPNREPPSDYSKSTGIRGCPSITILAPKTHVGQTISTHPTFAWFISDAAGQDARYSSTVKLKIAEFTADGQLKQLANPIELQIVPGIMKLPLEQLTLKVGQKYLWQVSVRCPDGSVVQRAELRVIEMPSSLKQNLATTEDSAQKADLYAQAGAWYDAIAFALEVAQNGKLGQVGSNLVLSLVRVEESQFSENSTQLEEIRQQVARLKQIAQSDR
ncbi:protein of unknown function (DUF928) [Pleurocapsa sp. PCC 7327]|uniref:DUF928 domain-containing protein n=1 Tax=Pleurocapsa sp. PCC 7327 TaxID=118163 RepID=UPI00029FCC36|nr:DUF928 domain-containing protein [Pleurocapsa sp. PCC 7327]AFY78186.1 protein of unknown function (DUF928) [Pleurocapsa sp. PCC 7327]